MLPADVFGESAHADFLSDVHHVSADRCALAPERCESLEEAGLVYIG